MDFNRVLRGALPTFASNFSGGGGNSTKRDFPDGVIESLMPLLGGHYNPLVKLLVLLYNMVGGRLGFDPTVILTIVGFLWAGNKLWRQVYMTLYGLVKQYLMASIHLSSNDEMYSHMMKWLASQPYMVNSRSLTADTVSKTAWEEIEDDVDLGTNLIRPDGSGITLNFSNQEAKSPPRFTPALGTHGFWFEGRYFTLHRKQESLYDDSSMGGVPQFKDREKLTISCFGRSPDPIKRLLQHAKEEYYQDHQAKTIVKRPSPMNVRRFGGRSWIKVANRPVRPMSTVVLDAKQKVNLLTDLNEFLHPAAPAWYSSRGIPLRRGYLFYGPPGTGKTSLSFALAGVFGLDIFVISLLEPSLTEEDLSGLFNSLPRRCVVLLEDIDTAGLSRVPEEEASDETTIARASKEEAKGHKSKEDWKVADLARELRKQGESIEKKGISLSGLLNAIDGVASQEGRVLIMTTNKPESLDEALIRPGRVDLQVGFSNSSQEQAKELFERMMGHGSRPRFMAMAQRATATTSASASASESGKRAQTSGGLNGTAEHNRPSDSQPNGVANGHATKPSDPDAASASAPTADPTEKTDAETPAPDDERPDITPRELKELAGEFAAVIPPGELSPAEIQGFLLKRKKHPRKAVEEAKAWAEAMVEQKASKKKVLQVQ